MGHLRVTFHLSTSPSEVDLETLELGLTEIVAARPEVRTLGALYACDQLLLAEARQGEGIVFEAPETN